MASNTKLLAMTACAAIFLIGCATSTGVVSIGEDTYMLGTSGKSPGGFTGTEAKALAFEQASQFCESKGKKMQIVNTQQSDMSFGKNASAEIQFMCLTAGDSELGRPRLTKVPDSVIEIKGSPGAAPRAQPSATRDLYSEMLKLEDLKKRGLLSDTEFEEQRRRLLSER